MISWRRLVVLAAAVWSAGPALASSRAPQTVHGLAVTESGKPLPNAIVYLWGLLDNDRMGFTQVTTDGAGAFSWAVPAGEEVDEEGSSVPGCGALPCDASQWTAALSLAPGYPPDDAIEQVLDPILQRSTVRWTGTGPDERLVVTTPDTAVVNVRVLGPDGSALDNWSVEVTDADSNDAHCGAMLYHGRTDSNGWIHMRWFDELQSLQVIVPGVGYAATGSYVVGPGADLTVELPSLARFGSVIGILDSSVMQTGATVIGANAGDAWYVSTSSVGSLGQFKLTDLIPGAVHLSVVGGQGDPARERQDVQVGSGQTLTFQGIGPRQPPHLEFPLGGRDSSRTASVEGYVKYADGRPAGGVAVYAVADDSSVLSQSQIAFQTTSAANGSYKIDGLPVKHYEGVSVILIASARGCAPVARYVSSDEFFIVDGNWTSQTASSHRDIALHRDIVVGGAGGSLSVRVLDHGSPVVGEPVQATPEEGPPLDWPGYLSSEPGDIAVSVHSLVMPIAITDRSGVAQFDNLPPGLWNISAGAVIAPPGHNWLAQTMPSTIIRGSASGIAVNAGISTAYTLAVAARDARVHFGLYTPGGKPAAGGSASLVVCQTGNLGFLCPVVAVGSTGQGFFDASEFGLWTIEPSFRDAPVLDDVPTQEPYYTATSVLAVSPVFSNAPPTVLTGVERKPGSIHVSMVDGKGAPVSGSVTFDAKGPHELHYGLTVGPDGTGTFDKIPSGQYELSAWSYNLPPGASPDIRSKIVTVVSGQVSDVVFLMSEPATSSEPANPLHPLEDSPQVASAMADPQFAQRAPVITGAVHLSNGSPADGARLVVFNPKYPSDSNEGATDAAGSIYDAPPSYLGMIRSHLDSASEEAPMVAALIPGYCGGVVAPFHFGQPVNLTLPKPVELRGSVTINKLTPGVTDSMFLVRAEYQGQGDIDDFLSVETTPQVDGSFILRGLTPGLYLVQAARDGIWFSKSARILVDQNKSLSPVTLDIPLPGDPVEFHFSGHGGPTLADEPVVFDPPPGPLTDVDWPNTFRTDGQGILRFDGLSAGRHTCKVGGWTCSFNVPRYRPGDADLKIAL